MTPQVFSLLPTAYIGRDASILDSIIEPNAYLAMWHRSVPRQVASWIDLWIKDSSLAFDGTLSMEMTCQTVAHVLSKARCPDGVELAWLSEDVHRLVAIFSKITSHSQIRIRLETVRDDGCEKFHVDTLNMRLLCTYAGPGTEWVPAGAARRDYLGWTAGSTEEANAHIVPNPDSIQTMGTGAVAIFKGRLHPGFENQAFVHRSAPVCCAKEFRLRLCLDLPR